METTERKLEVGGLCMYSIHDQEPTLMKTLFSRRKSKSDLSVHDENHDDTLQETLTKKSCFSAGNPVKDAAIAL